MSICERHDKHVADEKDLAAYEERPFCVKQGDCECPICSRICWDSECAVVAEAEESPPMSEPHGTGTIGNCEACRGAFKPCDVHAPIVKEWEASRAAPSVEGERDGVVALRRIAQAMMDDSVPHTFTADDAMTVWTAAALLTAPSAAPEPSVRERELEAALRMIAREIPTPESVWIVKPYGETIEHFIARRALTPKTGDSEE